MALQPVYPGYKIDLADRQAPISPDQVKARLRIDASDTSLDDQIPELIKAAQQYVERYTKCILYSSCQILQRFDGWPSDRVLRLTFFPIDLESAVTIICMTDAGEIALDVADYRVDDVSFPHRIRILDDTDLPTLTEGFGVISITATYGAAGIERTIAPLVQCMYMLIAAWLENPNDQDQSDLSYVHKILDQYTAR